MDQLETSITGAGMPVSALSADSRVQSILDFWRPNLLILGPGSDTNTDLGPTHVFEQLSFI